MCLGCEDDYRLQRGHGTQWSTFWCKSKKSQTRFAAAMTALRMRQPLKREVQLAADMNLVARVLGWTHGSALRVVEMWFNRQLCGARAVAVALFVPVAICLVCRHDGTHTDGGGKEERRSVHPDNCVPVHLRAHVGALEVLEVWCGRGVASPGPSGCFAGRGCFEGLVSSSRWFAEPFEASAATNSGPSGI